MWQDIIDKGNAEALLALFSFKQILKVLGSELTVQAPRVWSAITSGELWCYFTRITEIHLACSIPKMSGIISDKNDSDHGVAQLRNTVLHTFVNSGNAQLFGNVMMKAVLDVG